MNLDIFGTPFIVLLFSGAQPNLCYCSMQWWPWLMVWALTSCKAWLPHCSALPTPHTSTRWPTRHPSRHSRWGTRCRTRLRAYRTSGWRRRSIRRPWELGKNLKEKFQVFLSKHVSYKYIQYHSLVLNIHNRHLILSTVRLLCPWILIRKAWPLCYLVVSP